MLFFSLHVSSRFEYLLMLFFPYDFQVPSRSPGRQSAIDKLMDGTGSRASSEEKLDTKEASLSKRDATAALPPIRAMGERGESEDHICSLFWMSWESLQIHSHVVVCVCVVHACVCVCTCFFVCMCMCERQETDKQSSLSSHNHSSVPKINPLLFFSHLHAISSCCF